MIAWKPKKIKIPEEHLLNGFMENPDGCGFMYPKEGKLVIEKPFYKYDDFIKRYKKAIKELHNPPVVIHFRTRASGAINDTNTMPLYVKKDKLGVCHNGVISEFAEWGDMYDKKKRKKVGYVMQKGDSDIVNFNNEILKNLPRGFLNNDAITTLMELVVGSYNKLVFMDYKGRVWFLNYKEGHWYKGVWYSSYSYLGRYNNYLKYYDSKDVYSYYPDDEKLLEGEVDQDSPEFDYCFSCQGELFSPLEKYEGLCWNCILEYGVRIDESEYDDPKILKDIKMMRESGWLPKKGEETW